MATQQVQPRADQPKVTTGSLKRGEQMPSLTYRQTGIKNTSGNRNQRDYARR